jgi:hypothetical protein
VSWEQLRETAELNRQFRQQELGQPPRACPNDGTPLLPSPPGAASSLYCPHDGWKYPDDDHRPAM